MRRAAPIHPIVDRLRDNAIVTVSLPGASGYRVSDFSATVVALIETGAVLHPLDVNARRAPRPRAPRLPLLRRTAASSSGSRAR